MLPQVHPLMSLPEACQQHASGLALIPYENERECSLRGVLHGAGGCESVSLFIGPEGGWDPEEVALAHSNDVVPVSLGQRILRAETAAVAAITAVMYSQGELGR